MTDAESRERKLLTVEALTGDMLTAARGSDWERVGELEAARTRIIAAAFDATVPAGDAPDLAVIVRRILEQDRALLSLGRSTLDECARELKVLTRGRRACAAYTA